MNQRSGQETKAKRKLKVEKGGLGVFKGFLAFPTFLKGAPGAHVASLDELDKVLMEKTQGSHMGGNAFSGI